MAMVSRDGRWRVEPVGDELVVYELVDGEYRRRIATTQAKVVEALLGAEVLAELVDEDDPDYE